MNAEPKPPAGRQPDARVNLVRVMAGLMALLGALMIVLALAGGGGAGSYGVLVGAFFLAAGVLRLRSIHLRSKLDR
ncbi:MAG: hypothetical protein PGN13_09060 [Patulibacter minatonensis]